MALFLDSGLTPKYQKFIFVPNKWPCDIILSQLSDYLLQERMGTMKHEQTTKPLVWGLKTRNGTPLVWGLKTRNGTPLVWGLKTRNGTPLVWGLKTRNGAKHGGGWY